MRVRIIRILFVLLFFLVALSVEAQQEAFNNSQESFNLGAMTSFDFEQTRFRLVDAQSKLINAKYDFVFKTKVLDFYLGKSLVD